MTEKQTVQITFNACEHLDFSDTYAAKKEAIHTSEGTKICWNRPVTDSFMPSLVQFCKLRGRLNYPTYCLCDKDKKCSDYKDFNHTVSFQEDI